MWTGRPPGTCSALGASATLVVVYGVHLLARWATTGGHFWQWQWGVCSSTSAWCSWSSMVCGYGCQVFFAVPRCGGVATTFIVNLGEGIVVGCTGFLLRGMSWLFYPLVGSWFFLMGCEHWCGDGEGICGYCGGVGSACEGCECEYDYSGSWQWQGTRWAQEEDRRGYQGRWQWSSGGTARSSSW